LYTKINQKMASYKVDIYKLICEDDPEFLYVGSTKNWKSRKKNHKDRSTYNETKGQSKLKVYQQIRALGGWDKIKMVLIEHYECQSKREAEAREQYHIEQLKPNMNAFRAYRTEEKRVKENRLRCSLFYKANKAEQVICECGALTTRFNKSHHCKSKVHKDWVVLVEM
jgi:hypothetical protein